MDYRIATAFAFAGKEKEFPLFRDKTHFRGVDASKIKCLVKLARHLLKDDRAAVPTFTEDGVAEYPSLPDHPKSERRPQKRKILIHQEFVMMAPMVMSVSSLFTFHVTFP
jgi:hypothetical protein